MPDCGTVCFEQPLNERIRTFMRLEYLLARLRYHEHDTSVWGRHTTMTALLDSLTIMARHNMRAEVSKALGAYYARLERLRAHEAVDDAGLKDVLARLDTLGQGMQRIPPQFASVLLRDNELLNSLNNRHAIPGGSCGFDIPSYQHWLSRRDSEFARDINHWCRHIVPIENAVNALLQFLRDGADTAQHEARRGVLVYRSDAGTQLIRVFVDNDRVYPEISAGRHRATIRFMEYYDRDLNVRQCRHTIAFRMACCQL